MKKTLLCVVAAIATLAACTKTETTYVGHEKEIGFSTNMSPMSKAALPDDATLGVFAALNTGETYFENTSFGKVGTIWTSDPAKLYPNTGSLNFTVYSPYISKDRYMTVTDGSIICPIPAGTDFLYGTEKYTGDKNTTSAIPVNLRHAKTAVCFNIKAEALNVYEITKITLTKVVQEGKIKVTYGDQLNVAWTDKVVGDLVLDTPKAVTKTDTPFAADQYLIPSDTADTGEDVMKDKIIIEYTMNGVAVPNFEVQLTEDWLAGRRYVYNIYFTKHAIEFSPSVEDWIDVQKTLDPSAK